MSSNWVIMGTFLFYFCGIQPQDPKEATDANTK